MRIGEGVGGRYEVPEVLLKDSPEVYMGGWGGGDCNTVWMFSRVTKSEIEISCCRTFFIILVDFSSFVGGRACCV